MAAEICPTIDAANTEAYDQQMHRVASFVLRIHIDVADGSMTPNRLAPLEQVWWPGGVRADIHVMYKRPQEQLDMLIALGPQLVIFHAEAEGDFLACAKVLHHHGIEAGVALLPQTPVAVLKPGLEAIDHVLIFSGNPGHFGGTADLKLAEKARQLRQLKPTLEIGWDGGVNERNVLPLLDAGIDVLNAGGFIQKASDPQAAYAILSSAIAG